MNFNSNLRTTIVLIAVCLIAWFPQLASAGDPIPQEVPPRRSTQLNNGFGVNLPLPRDPRLPWTQHWWTRVFDSGVKWVRLGQYENSSEKTGWDWVEQTPGAYHVLPEVDEAVRSLADNGVSIEVQLCYGNALYQGDRAHRPKHVDPAPPSIGQDDRPANPIFHGLVTDDEMQGFLNYTRFMVERYKGKIAGWELWNEANINYWQPPADTNEELIAKAKQYGKAFCRFADVVHEADPKSKVIFGGTSSIDSMFVLNAIIGCPEKIDVMAYHAYPGFGSNHAPEEADALVGADSFRESVLRFPGIRKNIEFWDGEWNVTPGWRNSNESVQARYLARYYLQAKAQNVKGFVWEFIPGTDGNEGDQFGLIHGDTSGADAFHPREAYRTFEVTSALFGQTERDPSCEIELDRDPGIPQKYSHGELRQYCFRDSVSGKPIYAIWLAVYAAPEDRFESVVVVVPIPDPQIQTPILIDVRTGKITPAVWKDRQAKTITVNLKDSVIAVADASYFNWPQAPEAPSGLVARQSGDAIQLEWKGYADTTGFEIQRSEDWGIWQKVTQLRSDHLSYSEKVLSGKHISYRVRAVGAQAPSAWSNSAWVDAAQ